MASHNKATRLPTGRSVQLRALWRLPLLVGALLIGSCRDPEIPDLNNPSIDDLASRPTRLKVIQAAQGLLVGARLNIAEFNGYVSELGLFGRESYIFDPGDNRFETELLGPGPLDPGGPRFGGNLWVARFANIHAANILLNALDNPGLTDLTAQEKEATRGFALTIEALDFLEVINTRDTLGAPIDVNRSIGAPLAPIQPRDSVFNHIVRLLDSAQTHLTNGSAFPFGLPAGFTGFTTPATFLQFNRALKAQVDVYQGVIFNCTTCFSDALTALAASFIDTVPADLNVGVYHTFRAASGDLTNGLYDPAPAKLYAHPSLKDSAETQSASTALDKRFLSKVSSVTNRVYLRHSSSFGFTRYASNADGVPIIRNEELVLLRAEANIGLGSANYPAAGADLNYIRVHSGGLAAKAFTTLTTRDAMITELLHQKRYSLLFEGGHSWIDYRHYGKLTTLLPTQSGDNMYTLMPVPLDECLPRSRPSRGCP